MKVTEKNPKPKPPYPDKKIVIELEPREAAVLRIMTAYIGGGLNGPRSLFSDLAAKLQGLGFDVEGDHQIVCKGEDYNTHKGLYFVDKWPDNWK